MEIDETGSTLVLAEPRTAAFAPPLIGAALFAAVAVAVGLFPGQSSHVPLAWIVLFPLLVALYLAYYWLDAGRVVVLDREGDQILVNGRPAGVLHGTEGVQIDLSSGGGAVRLLMSDGETLPVVAARSRAGSDGEATEEALEEIAEAIGAYTGARIETIGPGTRFGPK